MFRYRWFRRLFTMGPMPKDELRTLQSRLSKFYIFVTCNAAGLIFYYTYRDNLDLVEGGNHPGSLKYAALARGQNIEYVEIKGGKVTANKSFTAEETKALFDQPTQT